MGEGWGSLSPLSSSQPLSWLPLKPRNRGVLLPVVTLQVGFGGPGEVCAGVTLTSGPSEWGVCVCL